MMVVTTTNSVLDYHSAVSIKANYTGIEELIPEVGFVIRSDKMKKVAELIKAVADTSATVLISGRTGTGKELVAKAISKLSHRPRLVVLDCTTISADLVENELFGSERGSYTGALGKPGLIEGAENGTLFIDEISELSLAHQARLLRFLEEKTMRRIGSNQEKKVENVRVVVATNRDLLQMVADGKFREDLYERLDVIKIDIPSLADRRDDIPALVAFFMDKLEISKISNQAFDSLMEHSWPRNVRELRNVMHRASIMQTYGKPIDSFEFRKPVVTTDENSDVDSSVNDLSLDSVVNLTIKEHIKLVLNKNGGNKTKTAKDLKIGRSDLYLKMKKHGLKFDEATN